MAEWRNEKFPFPFCILLWRRIRALLIFSVERGAPMECRQGFPRHCKWNIINDVTQGDERQLVKNTCVWMRRECQMRVHCKKLPVKCKIALLKTLLVRRIRAHILLYSRRVKWYGYVETNGVYFWARAHKSGDLYARLRI